MQYSWHLFVMAGLYLLAGMIHFLKPGLYLKIMPDYLPAHLTLIYVSGACEIAGGIGLCFAKTHNFAIYGIIAMLLIFLLVHINMIVSPKAGPGISKWLLIGRVVLQFGLIYWAYHYIK